MDNNTAIKVLTSLAHGIDPETGEFLPNESVLNGLDATRALFFAVECMRDGMQRLILWETMQMTLPQEQGKPQKERVDQGQGNSLEQDKVQTGSRRGNRRELDGIWQYRPVTGIGQEKSAMMNDVLNSSADVSVNGSMNSSADASVNGSVNGSMNSFLNSSVNGSVKGSKNGSVNSQANGLVKGQNVKRIEMQPLDNEQQQLYETLKTWRNHLAMSQGYAPYMVLSNDSLARVACERPETIEALAKIKGFGEIKMQKYAIPILALVRGSTVSAVLGEKSENRPLQLTTPIFAADESPVSVGVGEGNQQFFPVFT